MLLTQQHSAVNCASGAQLHGSAEAGDRVPGVLHVRLAIIQWHGMGTNFGVMLQLLTGLI